MSGDVVSVSKDIHMYVDGMYLQNSAKYLSPNIIHCTIAMFIMQHWIIESHQVVKIVRNDAIKFIIANIYENFFCLRRKLRNAKVYYLPIFVTGSGKSHHLSTRISIYKCII